MKHLDTCVRKPVNIIIIISSSSRRISGGGGGGCSGGNSNSSAFRSQVTPGDDPIGLC